MWKKVLMEMVCKEYKSVLRLMVLYDNDVVMDIDQSWLDKLPYLSWIDEERHSSGGNIWCGKSFRLWGLN
jgi:hypothetical protein